MCLAALAEGQMLDEGRKSGRHGRYTLQPIEKRRPTEEKSFTTLSMATGDEEQRILGG